MTAAHRDIQSSMQGSQIFGADNAYVTSIASSRADRAQTAAADLGTLSVEHLIGDLSAHDWVGELVRGCVATARQRFPNDNPHLYALGALSEIAEAVRGQIDDLVVSARIGGVSWSDIGGRLGIASQAASQRWA